MNDDIVQMINEWNPVEIYPLLEDEYYSEIRRIHEKSKETNSVEELAEQIHSVFAQSFKKEFDKSIEECRLIAEKIINVTK
ncbi:YugE family protein [Paenibacillus sp. P2(2022)]|nr:MULTISPECIES: DUF1871 family protein [Paenibacillus]MEB4785068.1 DUF1871 family protein [Paenibacillus jamilae]AUS25817.1 hypothetical protein C1A50_1640 [Paenibacillus polymyxa]KJK32649.1 hypothetical protein TY89_02950 [Paenibacillus polymyxa]MDG0053779.1 YugE family protein [Paenibacillus sp. P2(2022)]MEE4561480.1 DUF1871 family protein [Paenibacillus polymyxa]